MNRKTSLLTWVILAALGVLIIVGRQFIKDIFYAVVAVGLILAALAGLYDWWKGRRLNPDGLARLVGYGALLIFGLWILTHASAFDTIINVVIGLTLIVFGVQWFVRGRPFGRDPFILAVSAISVVLGLVIACTGAATGWPIVLQGIGLIYAAVTGFLAEKRFG